MRFALLALALVACGPAFAPGTESPAGPTGTAVVVDVAATPPAASASTSPAPTSTSTPIVKAPPSSSAPSGFALPFRGGCKLAEPRKSDDACTTDADCGVAEPCHAKACVAKAKSNPPTPTTTCTRNLVCDSSDVNRCGCFEGRCALLPPP
jgi:hypothetical protein